MGPCETADSDSVGLGEGEAWGSAFPTSFQVMLPVQGADLGATWF